MVFFNYSTMQMAAKVVYYGPGLCGKTTNLHHIYGHTSTDSRGEMVSLETETDRTLFFDLLPIDVGSIAGFKTRIQLYTVPGQVFYNTTRKLVLKGVDGVVFVADSQRAMLQANVGAFGNLAENLAEMGLSLDTIPLVLQYNKRDLSDISSVEELNRALNRNAWQYFEASALTGQGVFETLKGISRLTLVSLKRRLTKSEAPAAPAPQPAPPAPGAAPAAASPAPRPQPAAPAVGAAGAPRAVVPPPAGAATRPRANVDILGELERLRQQTKGTSSARSTPVPPSAVRPAAPVTAFAPTQPAPMPPLRQAAGNGQREMSRDLQITLRRADFKRARRFTLNLKVEDADHRVVDAIRDLHVEFEGGADLEKLLLRLNIALNAKE